MVQLVTIKSAHLVYLRYQETSQCIINVHNHVFLYDCITDCILRWVLTEFHLDDVVILHFDTLCLHSETPLST